MGYLHGFILTFVSKPIWFQVIKTVDAEQSGIMSLAMVLSMVFATVLAGPVIGKVGYYAPFMIVTSVMASIGASLLTTLEVDSGPHKWIGYQVLIGIGIGIGMQQSSTVCRNVLGDKDVPIAISAVFFAQTISGTIFVSAAQAVFANRLIGNFAEMGDIDPQKVLRSGATQLKDAFSPSEATLVMEKCNAALTAIFWICLALALVSLAGSSTLEWRSIKPPKPAGKDVSLTMGRAEASGS
jgi:MFS family permease